VELNRRAFQRCGQLLSPWQSLRVDVHQDAGGACLVDCGLQARGGLQAGRALAEICLADLGHVQFQPARPNLTAAVDVSVTTDQPLAACMASQYAGWQIKGSGGFFAMGSGPMRAAAGKEALFEQIGFRERPERVVGVLESSRLPPADVVESIARDCGVSLDGLTLLIARTSSIAGTVQVVARSVETALHKLHELGFDLTRVLSGFGVAPLPPIAADDLSGIGRTNDAVLYGGEVTLWVDAEDDELGELGPQVPSAASSDFGQPFARLFDKYDRDFYRIDPLLFSPAVVTLVNVRSGRCHRHGEIRPDVLAQSFS
jgi:methenyltetrahydromethanopterin cyclohydrolase